MLDTRITEANESTDVLLSFLPEAREARIRIASRLAADYCLSSLAGPETSSEIFAFPSFTVSPAYALALLEYHMMDEEMVRAAIEAFYTPFKEARDLFLRERETLGTLLASFGDIDASSEVDNSIYRLRQLESPNLPSSLNVEKLWLNDSSSPSRRKLKKKRDLGLQMKILMP